MALIDVLVMFELELSGTKMEGPRLSLYSVWFVPRSPRGGQLCENAGAFWLVMS